MWGWLILLSTELGQGGTLKVYEVRNGDDHVQEVFAREGDAKTYKQIVGDKWWDIIEVDVRESFDPSELCWHVTIEVSGHAYASYHDESREERVWPCSQKGRWCAWVRAPSREAAIERARELAVQAVIAARKPDGR
jgi:hypothetical protein